MQRPKSTALVSTSPSPGKARPAPQSQIGPQTVKNFWLRREPHPHDQRAVQLVLTDAGRGAATRLGGARRARMATLLDAIPVHEREAVLHALDILARTLADPATRKEPHGA